MRAKEARVLTDDVPGGQRGRRAEKRGRGEGGQRGNCCRGAGQRGRAEEQVRMREWESLCERGREKWIRTRVACVFATNAPLTCKIGSLYTD